MYNKIPCTAQRIDQIYPYTLQSAVTAPTFKLGLQYLSHHRVKILEFDELGLASEVEGESGRYQQRIYLDHNSLFTRCSCTSPERPFCRHCVAVLLEFHRLTTVQGLDPLKEPARLAKPLSEEENPPSSVSTQLREITLFMDWLKLAVKALQSEQAFPEKPALGPGELRVWAQALQRLQERWQQSEAERAVLDADLAARMKQLEAAVQETHELHSVCEGLQQELARNRDLLARTAQERDQLGERLKATVDELILRHRLELEGLATSRQEISAALEALRHVEAPHLTQSPNES